MSFPGKKRFGAITPPATSTTVFTIDDASRVTAINHKNGAGTTLDVFNYQFDNADRATQETSTLGTTRNYSYDDTDQLLSDGTNSWSFDLAGNRTNTGYQTGAGNRLFTDGTWNYTWNDEGNLTQKVHATSTETWLYTYNHLNQMTKAEHKATAAGAVDNRVEFQYDVLGNRLEKSADTDGDGAGAATVTRFAYDEKGNAWADLNTQNEVQKRRLYLDAVYARIGQGTVDWYLTDRLGARPYRQHRHFEGPHSLRAESRC